MEVEPDIFSQECATRKILGLITGTWTVLVIHALETGTKRYSELKRQIEGITHKMLAQTLRALERDGLIVRKVHAIVPPKVEYSLTELGNTLTLPLAQLCQWAEIHFQEVEIARRNHAVEAIALIRN